MQNMAKVWNQELQKFFEWVFFINPLNAELNEEKETIGET